MITEPTPVHDGTHAHRAQTSGTEDREGTGAGAGASVPEDHAGALTPRPEATAQPSGPSLARRADGPMFAAPASPRSAELAEDRAVIARATPGPMEAVVLGSEGYAIRPKTGEMRQRARVAMCGYRAWEEDRANAEFIARAWTRWPALLNEVDDLRAIELAALVLLRASGPDASWGEHSTAERVLRDLLEARGHEVGECAE